MRVESLFDDSLNRAIENEVNGEAFFTAFYRRFLGTSKDIAEKFRDTDMPRQQMMLKKSFYSLVTFYATSHVEHYLEDVARKHGAEQLDIRPELYEKWLDTLISTVAVFDPKFDAQIELAWRLVMAPGIAYMKFYYDK